MDNPRSGESQRVFVYRGALPAGLLLLILAPILFLFLSVAVVALGAGARAAFFLPVFFRSRRRRSADDADCITLEHDQYEHVDGDRSRLPPR